MNKSIETIVRENYGRTAASGLSSNNAGVHKIAEAFGYSADELSSIPAEANMGLSCGNPTATANLRPGEVVLDLGSGGGLDVFLAAQKVGPTGRAIGIDMTPEMIELARKNAAKSSLRNIEFHLATIDKLPLADASVDVVISNCVINLAADKPAVFREIARVLKPGGRVAISDIALKKPLPDPLARDIAAYVGCIAGAMLMNEYQRALVDAGLTDVLVVDARVDLNAYSQADENSTEAAPPCCGPSCCGSVDAATTMAESSVRAAASQSWSLAQHNVNDWAASVKVYALKPHTRA